LWGSLSGYHQALRRFEQEQRVVMPTLKRRLLEGHTAELASRAHAIKGAVGNLALRRLYQCAADLEEAARVEDRTACITSVASLEREWEAFRAEISQWSANGDRPSDPASVTDVESARSALTALLEAAAVNELHEPALADLHSALGSEYDEVLRRLETAGAEFDFAGLREALEEVREYTLER